MLGYVLFKLKLKHVFVLICAISLCFYIIQLIVVSYFAPISPHPIMVWWTPFMSENERIINCYNKHTCVLTKDSNYVNNTDVKAFLFYGSDFNITNLPLPKNKIWALLHEESPRNLGIFLYNETYSFFEIASTFSRYSDFPLTLQYLENLSIITDTRYVVGIKEKNRLLNSIAPVLYIQSDCDTPIDRDLYVSELMKHVPIDSYGACLNNKKFPKEISEIYALDLFNDKLLNFIAKYKFVISFENAICDDYITEKLWRPLIAGSIPIYLGSPTVEDWLPNKNSAILVKNFPTPEILATRINEINRDDDLYEKFRQHKYGKIQNNFLKNTLNKGPFGLEIDQDHPILGFECFVCKSIHEGIRERDKKSIYDCLKPKEGNNWEYHWQNGDCQSKAFVNSVRNNVKLERDPCSIDQEA